MSLTSLVPRLFYPSLAVINREDDFEYGIWGPESRVCTVSRYLAVKVLCLDVFAKHYVQRGRP